MRKVSLRNKIGFLLKFKNFYEIYHAFKYKKNINLIKLWNGVVFEIDENFTYDAALLTMYNEIWNDDLYRIFKKKSIFNIKKNDIIIDLGANNGMFSILAARLAKKGRVIAVEPHPINFEYLQLNIKSSGVKNITTVNKAVDSSFGLKELNTDSFGTHSLIEFYEFGSEKIANAGNKIKIETVTLDGILEEFNFDKIDYLKIDIEGMEYEILGNLTRTTFKKIKKIVIEYHDYIRPNTKNYIENLLRKNDYIVDVVQHKSKHNIGMLYAIHKQH